MTIALGRPLPGEALWIGAAGRRHVHVGDAYVGKLTEVGIVI